MIDGQLGKAKVTRNKVLIVYFQKNCKKRFISMIYRYTRPSHKMVEKCLNILLQAGNFLDFCITKC